MGKANRPLVMEIVPISKRNQKARIGNAIHYFEKPLRMERVAPADTLPAKRRNGRSSSFRAFSN